MMTFNVLYKLSVGRIKPLYYIYMSVCHHRLLLLRNDRLSKSSVYIGGVAGCAVDFADVYSTRHFSSARFLLDQ